jgi:hypothetical protein
MINKKEDKIILYKDYNKQMGKKYQYLEKKLKEAKKS